LSANHYLFATALYIEKESCTKHWKLIFFNESILKVEDSERELLNKVEYEKLIMVLMLAMSLETFNIHTVCK